MSSGEHQHLEVTKIRLILQGRLRGCSLHVRREIRHRKYLGTKRKDVHCVECSQGVREDEHQELLNSVWWKALEDLMRAVRGK